MTFDDLVREKHLKKMEAIAQALNEILNGAQAQTPEIGFVLVTFKLSELKACCYISNAERESVMAMLKEQILAFEQRPEDEGEIDGTED